MFQFNATLLLRRIGIAINVRTWCQLLMVSHDLLNILACPACKGKLALPDADAALLCSSCNLKFPIREGIPVMLLDKAETVLSSIDGGRTE